ncbi:MAG: hypothetical protein MPN21_09620 [Thermoanaerobaculia bacterium]|nr:hypothetical protein [Thermoanaerobaculia bacterium]
MSDTPQPPKPNLPPIPSSGGAPGESDPLAEAKRRLEDMDWHGAVEVAEQVLSSDPQNPEANRLRDTGRRRVDELEAKLQRMKRVANAKQDIARLIDAGELQGAAEHLRRAMNALGNEPALVELEQSLQTARDRADLARQNEWARRRQREAQALIDESARLATRGDYEGMLEKLRQAKRVDPEHDQIDQLLATGQRQAEEHARQEVEDRQIRAAEASIRRLLDSLHLEQAETRLHAARRRFGEPLRFDPLQRRLEDLRRSARIDMPLPTPENLKNVAQLAPIIRRKERSLAEAYSWNAALLFPLRRPVLWLSLAGVLLVLDLVVYGLGLNPAVGLLGPLLGLILLPAITRTTLEGVNDPPSPQSLLKHARVGIDAAIVFGSILAFGLPLLLLILTRRLHPLLEADSGPLGWLLLAILLWGACALLVPAWGVAAAFGASYVTRLDRLVSCLVASGRGVLTVNAIFVYFALGLVLRAFAHDLAPAVGLPVLALFEAYGLVLLPHLLGIMVRNRRLDWAILHAT